ncbi:DNA helicase-2/ATP-dependent DNA helicase PcrA [Spinactinospora alkalitolerans]|uniref:DNA 3'-5' helicase n=1 Tax=Spinactinospora alkalitolerans TaxID=687207 RepID=A0A852TQD2_9ACTN|nr:ATP-dependent DNA helicase [Spinactinospora alkalitolerans]NYE45741.1 DNA helicase-2/ATP-dependent DNA helicase PcrA [Spinactinospora alkalitolerans]
MTETLPSRTFGPAQLARLLGQPEPTAEQAAVISAPLAPGVVVAGAGSGKSETMAGRVVWLVANGHVRPENLLGLTFTRKAASELAERVRKRLDQLRGSGAVPDEVLDGEPTVSTYHSYASRLVGDHALREAVEPSARLITQAVAWQLANQIVSGYDGPMSAVNSVPETVVRDVLALSGELAEHLRTPDDVRRIGAWLRERADALPESKAPTRELLAAQEHREQLLPLLEGFAEAKAAREVMDFGDQVALAARIARRHPEVGLIEKSRYHVVLLDEYQDTSHAQLVLLRALFGDAHPVTAVGDPCQSIYGWRGASSGNLTGFPTDFPERPGRPASVRQLATSFRNGERVLAVAKRIAEPLRAQADSVPVLHPGPARRGRGFVTGALLATETEEAEWIAGQIEIALRESRGTHRAPDGLPWPEQENRGPLSPGDVAILCRKRSQFPLLRERLELRGIPVEVVGLGGLVNVPEVRDIVATLRVLNDPAAGNELARLLTGPRWRLGASDLVALNRRATELAEESRRDLNRSAPAEPDRPADPLTRTVFDLTAESGSLLDALDDLGPAERYSPTGHERLTALAEELRALRRLVAQPLPDLITDIERTLGLDIEVGARTGRDPVAARADLDAFIDVAARFVGTSEAPTLSAFLAFLRSAEDTERGLAPGERVGSTDTVKLMTVHAAKGLQWPMVVVPGLSQTLFPTRPGAGKSWTGRPAELPFPLRGDSVGLPRLTDVDDASIKRFREEEKGRDTMEERRLAYVAVTRAAFALLCTGHRWGAGTKTAREPSPFLEEVREACAAGAGRIAQWAPAPGETETNPQLVDVEPVAWPHLPEDYVGAAADRHREVVAGARLVEEARAGAGAPWLEQLERAAVPESWNRRLKGWQRDTDLLLAHRDTERTDDGAVTVELPAHLTVSSLVSLARDPAALARQIRRPLPRPPAPHTRRGTAFHLWLEQRFGQESLLDPDELPGAADEAVGRDDDLSELQRLFEAGEWGGRIPLDVEVPFETVIGDRLVRGRMDAVFHDEEHGHYDVVDWKTGRPPGTDRERRAVAVQLAAYRIAWAQLAGVPLEHVRAAFHYVRTDLTIRPADLLDADGLAALIDRIPEAE